MSLSPSSGKTPSEAARAAGDRRARLIRGAAEPTGRQNVPRLSGQLTASDYFTSSDRDMATTVRAHSSLIRCEAIG
jgi:hypothetical protein